MNRDSLQLIFAFLAVFGLVLFLVRPEPNTAQTVFRLALAAIGGIGLAVMRGWRRGG